MDIIMPKMGESVSEGTIIKWHKNQGDSVKRDEIIFEISTDKVDTEIPSPGDGVITEIIVKEGETVEVGTIVARLGESGNGEQAENKTAEAANVNPPENETVTAEENKVPGAQDDEGATGGSVIEIAMPKMGESVMEGTIIKWHKKVGESVKKDETIFEISTDKVDTEVPSPEAGILTEILVAEQETVEVGTIVAKLSTGSKAVPGNKSENKPAEQKDISIPESMHDNFSSVSARNDEKVPEQKNTEMKQGRFYSPLVLNIAQKENISFDELASINGTGLEGRVTKKDLMKYLEDRNKNKAVQTSTLTNNRAASVSFAAPQTGTFTSGEVEKIPMDNIRQKIMQHMINSRDTSVHVSAMLEVDMAKIYNFIQAKKNEFMQKEGIKLTYMPFIANAVVKALKEYPLVNSIIDGATIIKKNFVNLGIAVAIEPTGLIVPNIKRADEKNIIGLAKSITDIASRSRNKKLSPDDISNGTFTITNYGVFGTIFGTPIINQPEVAILGVGAVIKRPVVVEAEGYDTIAIKPIMALTLTHDHRLIDGMLGGRFLKFVKDTLENFDSNSF
jgi:2-oxoglutarate dehydrogenase E2 component (dihydrolipoamide succinyltransferase)